MLHKVFVIIFVSILYQHQPQTDKIIRTCNSLKIVFNTPQKLISRHHFIIRCLTTPNHTSLHLVDKDCDPRR